MNVTIDYYNVNYSNVHCPFISLTKYYTAVLTQANYSSPTKKEAKLKILSI